MRRKRVQIIKKIIVTTFLLLMIVPSISCIYLLFRVHTLEKQLENVHQAEGNSITASVQNSAESEGQELTSTQNSNPMNLEEEATEDIEKIENQKDWQQNSAVQVRSDDGIHKVYLTFDDGPSSNTDKILDILDEYGVKATFFVVGKEGFEDQYQRIVREGHTLGMHSYSHKYQEIYQSLDAYSADLNKIQTFLYEMTGVTSEIVRFPGGSSNTVSKTNMQDLITYLNEEGITYYDWNVSSGDAAGYVSARQITDNVMNYVGKYQTAIVLMHDAGDKDTTVEALPGIIEQILESDNTVILPITEETNLVQHVKAECQ